MDRVLVAYATNSGSTAEVAAAAAAALSRNGHAAEALAIADVKTLGPYKAVVVGAPMILGWHKEARRFVSRHQAELRSKKVAYFACAMTLTEDSPEWLQDLPLTIDPNLVSKPEKEGALSFRERFTSAGHYLRPMLGAAPEIDPISVAFFHGKLNMTRLKWWQALFVMAVVRAVPGDYRDWDAVRAWADSLAEML